MKNDHEIKISRLIAVDRETLFDAWLEVEGIKRWMCPDEGVTVPDPKLEAKVGGKFDFTMKVGNELIPHFGEYFIIDRPNQLQFTWNSVNTHNLDTMVYITFKEISSDETEITLVHKYLPDSDSAGDHTWGWNGIMDSLKKSMESAVV